LNACPFCLFQYTALHTICNCHLFCMRSGSPPILVALSTWQQQLQAFLSSRLLGGYSCSCLLCPACLFMFHLSDCLSPSLWGSRSPDLFAMCLFFNSAACLLFFVFFSFFPLGGGQSVQGTMLIWPRVLCGNTTCCLAHQVVCFFPTSLGAGIWPLRSPPGFSI
jgi:hypothetical protein